VLAAIKGTYETKKMGNDESCGDTRRDRPPRRLLRKKMGGYDMEVFPCKGISSIETGKGLTGHHVKFYASGNEVRLKWIDKGSDAPASSMASRSR
jgi:Bacterial PH domain